MQTPWQQLTRSFEKVSLSYSTSLGDVRVRIDANSKRSQVTRPKNDFKQHLRGVSQVMGAEQLKKSTMQMLKAWSLWKSFLNDFRSSKSILKVHPLKLSPG